VVFRHTVTGASMGRKQRVVVRAWVGKMRGACAG